MASADDEIPSFMDETTHTATIGGRKLVFHAVSSSVLFELQRALGPQLAKVIDAFASQQPHEVRQAAIGELVGAVSSNSELTCKVILDALHEEKWVARPVTAQTISAFFKKTDGPNLARMLAAVAQVNAEAFGPFVLGLLVQATGGLEAFSGKVLALVERVRATGVAA